MSKQARHLHQVVRKIEHLLSTKEADHARVRYMPLVARSRKVKLSRRASQLYTYLKKHPGATSKDIQAALGINRNSLSGATFKLRQAKLLKAENVAA